VEYQAAQTVLTGFLDRSAMYGVLSRFEMLGLDLVQVRRSPDPHAPVDDEVDPAEPVRRELDQPRAFGGIAQPARLQRHHLATDARTSSAVSSAASTATSHPTISAPSRANARAVARPMAPPVPVITQIFPASRSDISVSFLSNGELSVVNPVPSPLPSQAVHVVLKTYSARQQMNTDCPRG
jgi:hypothetical protein